ncbi:MAG: hypothetical protein RR719_03665 [Akkermansia sp.]
MPRQLTNIMNWQTIQKHLNIPVDGIPGSQTALQVAHSLNLSQHDWKSIQTALKITADGIPGENTAQAVSQALGILEEKRGTLPQWPTQTEIRSNKSLFGYSGDSVPLVSVSIPYCMKLSWDTSSQTTKISCHQLIAEPIKRIFEEVFTYYGSIRINQLGLNLYGGCFNDRKIVGGVSKSMHAWGIAIDLDPEHNGLKIHRPNARFSAREYEPFWEIIENQGAVSLGRERDYDWMHFQFARL